MRKEGTSSAGDDSGNDTDFAAANQQAAAVQSGSQEQQTLLAVPAFLDPNVPATEVVSPDAGVSRSAGSNRIAPDSAPNSADVFAGKSDRTAAMPAFMPTTQKNLAENTRFYSLREPETLLPEQFIRRNTAPIINVVPDPSARSINFHYHESSSPVSAWRKSISKLVSEKASQDNILAERNGSETSSRTVIDAILSSQWADQDEVKQTPSEDTTDELERRCHPKSCLYYPHYAFIVTLRWMRKHKRQLRWLAFLAWITYVIYVQIYSFYIMEQDYDACNGGGLVAWVSAVILLYIMLFRLILPHIHHVRRLKRSICIRPFECCRVTCQYTLVRLATCAIVFVLIVMLTHQGRFVPSTHQCIALSGYFAIILIAYFLSVEPEKIDWRLVIKNLLIQIIIVYSMMIWTFGRVLLQCTAEKITVFFSFSKEAAAVVFSDQLPHMLAIELLCTLTLTGCYMHILYYLGILQSFFHKLGFILEMITGATAVEAICAALCTLCGGVEAAVVLEPYIVLLTMSELHTFIVSGFAFMTGVTLSLYMSLGIDQVNLMTANFATCSGVLALSKIVYPETDRSVTTYKDLKFLDRDEYNLVDAAVRGATAIIKVLVNVISGLIAMVSVVNMSNTFVGWVLENIGIPGMDIIGILSFISRPLIFLMGVEWQYSDKVARLFIIKTVKNENFAYRAFSKLQQTDPIPMREQAVTTALLYGYSNIAHIGVITALMTVLAPERRQDISITVMRAMFTSVLVNMLTASVIGALVTPHDLKLAQNVTNLNVSAHWTR